MYSYIFTFILVYYCYFIYFVTLAIFLSLFFHFYFIHFILFFIFVHLICALNFTSLWYSRTEDTKHIMFESFSEMCNENLRPTKILLFVFHCHSRTRKRRKNKNKNNKRKTQKGRKERAQNNDIPIVCK